MKKQYINPKMEIVIVKTATLLAGSLPGGGSTDQNLAPEYDVDIPEPPYLMITE